MLETTLDCNQYVSMTQFDSDVGVYYAGFNGSDLEFLDPNNDQNLNTAVLAELDMTIAISDSTYTANTDAYMTATFLDQGKFTIKSREWL